jgi:hypothetical protein
MLDPIPGLCPSSTTGQLWQSGVSACYWHVVISEDADQEDLVQVLASQNKTLDRDTVYKAVAKFY